MVRNEPQEFTEAVIESIKNRKLANRLINDGYELVGNKYACSVICKGIDEAFNELLSKTGKDKKSEITIQPV